MTADMLAPGEKLFQEERKATFRKEEFTYIHTGIVDSDGCMWTTTEMDEANLFQVYNQYREKHGILFPDQITRLREHYGLSVAKMSQILGFGINQYRMYEDGEVPSLSNARTILAARDKAVFLSFVEASKSELSEREYCRIIKKVENVDGDCSTQRLPSVFSGFRAFDKSKTSLIVRYMIARLGPVFVTKMNKLLFYADFLHYRKHAFGITGIEYRALPFGPVPDCWGRLYAGMPGVSMEEYVYPNGQSGVKLDAENVSGFENLSAKEIQTLDRVCSVFSSMNAGAISKASHLEKGWLHNQATRSLISYQDAFELNYD